MGAFATAHQWHGRACFAAQQGVEASGSGSETLDATCHDSIYWVANRGLTHWSGSSSTPWKCHLDVGYDPFDRCWETRALTAGPGRREIDARGAWRLRQSRTARCSDCGNRAAHRPSRCWVRKGARLRAGISLGSSRSATVRRSIIKKSCISIPTISDTAGFGDVPNYVAAVPKCRCDGYRAALSSRWIPSGSLKDRIALSKLVEFFDFAVFDAGLAQSLCR